MNSDTDYLSPVARQVGKPEWELTGHPSLSIHGH